MVTIILAAKSFEEKIRYIKQKKDYRLIDFVNVFKRKINTEKSIKVVKYLTAFLIWLDVLLEKMTDYLNKRNDSFNEDFLNEFYKNLQQYSVEYDLESFYRFLTDDFAKMIDIYIPYNGFEISKFLVELYDIENHIEHKESFGIHLSRRTQFTLNYSNQLGTFLNNYLDVVENQSLLYNIEWEGISSGHKAYINLFAKFHSIYEEVKEDNVLVCIDEGDLYFHPKWQTEFLYKLINILPKLLGKPCQIVLTTHSPFLVSDLPKDNLIFVERNSVGDLLVIDKNKIEGNTFGGNIGELYIDAFFMDGSLISFFAASKIQELITKINNREKISKEDRILIDKIGEDFIRTQINKLLNGENRR